MIGEQLGETKGRRLVRRVTSTDPTTVEVTFEDSGDMLGVATMGLGTYTSVVGLDGSLFGEGQGVNMTQDGEAVSWKATEFGSRGGRGDQLSGNAVFQDGFSEAGAAEQCVWGV